MMLRDYQAQSCTESVRHLQRGHNTLLVAPTGAGKTVMGAAIVAALGRPTTWIAHRVELTDQARARLPGAVQVISPQSLLCSGAVRDDCELVVFDEAHHLSATGEWRNVLPEGVPVLGLTATPQRGDGQPLGDVFRRLVVSAPYSRLIADGHLLPCEVTAPPEPRGGIRAEDISRACPSGGRGFVYVGSVSDAERVAYLLESAAVVTAETRPAVRAGAVQALRDGAIQWLVNVGTMTEGTDVPAADTAVIARPVGTTGLWLQMAGRVLRPSPGKTHGRVIDLCGSVWTHGSPTQDRTYSLRGDGISKPPSKRSVASVIVCESCWTAYQSLPRCPTCGGTQARNSKGTRLDLSSLVVVYSGGATDGIGDQIEAWRVSGVHWREVRRRCRALFGTAPPIPWAPIEDKRAEYRSLLAVAQQTGRAAGWAAHRYRGVFGTWPGG